MLYIWNKIRIPRWYKSVQGDFFLKINSRTCMSITDLRVGCENKLGFAHWLICWMGSHWMKLGDYFCVLMRLGFFVLFVVSILCAVGWQKTFLLSCRKSWQNLPKVVVVKGLLFCGQKEYSKVFGNFGQRLYCSLSFLTQMLAA